MSVFIQYLLVERVWEWDEESEAMIYMVMVVMVERWDWWQEEVMIASIAMSGVYEGGKNQKAR